MARTDAFGERVHGAALEGGDALHQQQAPRHRLVAALRVEQQQAHHQAQVDLALGQLLRLLLGHLGLVVVLGGLGLGGDLRRRLRQPAQQLRQVRLQRRRRRHVRARGRGDGGHRVRRALLALGAHGPDELERLRHEARLARRHEALHQRERRVQVCEQGRRRASAGSGGLFFPGFFFGREGARAHRG